MRGQAGVPSAEHNRQGWVQLLDRLGYSHRGSDMGPGQDGNPEQESVFRFAQNGLFIIREKQVIDELDFESSLQQGRCETKQG